MKTQVSNYIHCRKSYQFKSDIIMKFERQSNTKRKQIMNELKRKIEVFLTQDINSRVCPGKKDFITRKKIVDKSVT